MIGARILKIDLEIAEIFKVKDGTRHLEVDILLLLRGKKIVTGGNFDLNLSQPFLICISKFFRLSCSKFPEFFKTHLTFEFWLIGIAKNKLEPILWDTCIFQVPVHVQPFAFHLTRIY